MTCMYDLRVFMFFFSIQTIFFGMAFNVIGADPAPEYKSLPKMARNIINSLRISVGNFKFKHLMTYTEDEQKVFWTLWVIVFLFGCLIFLNFIIAEVSDSYVRVRE